MGSKSGIFSMRRVSSTSNEPPDTEAFEIAVEVSAGEPLRFSEKLVKEHIISAQ